MTIYRTFPGGFADVVAAARCETDSRRGVQPPVRVNVRCVTPLGDEVASMS
jgi:hypothetical protein